jgi:Asp-tRNA(Asn)/Glu-tRNA(Gln) amidotransferase A subunit family amidase
MQASTSGMSLLENYDALGLAELVRRKEIHPSELLELAIERAEALNPKYNFLARRLYERGRAAIAAGLPEGPFAGVPWLVKDLNTHIAGEVTEQGSSWYQENVVPFSSEIVRRYERAGLVIFGKTTTPEFGLSPTTESRVAGLTRNPWNTDYSSGGSSGGASAAVAAGALPAAHATDGGGSIRIPASCCGLFGLKPSRGRVPVGPPLTERWDGMSVHHAVTRTVRDSAALLDAVHGYEPGGRFTAPAPERPYLDEVGRDPGRLRIAFTTKAPGDGPVHPECVQAVRDAAALLERLGHYVEDAAPSLDWTMLGQAATDIICASLAAEFAAREAATGLAPGPQLLEPVTLGMASAGRSVTGVDYVRASAAHQAAAAATAAFMERFDLTLSPVLAEPPAKLGELGLAPADMEAYGRRVKEYASFSMVQNQTGQPSMATPFAMSSHGLPIGVMFTARYGEEALLFRLAGQIEQERPWGHLRPPRGGV